MPASLKFSDEERELLDTIHDAPHDVGPYLAYADWLEERGHPMGEFIRLRLAIEKRHVEKPAQQCEVMRKRANDLLSTHGKDWSRPVSREFEYRGHTINGIPYAQDQPFEDFERADGWLRRMSPRLFLGIHLSSCGDELASQLRHPFLRRVHGVRFYLPNYLFRPNQNDGGYRMIADADVLKRCFSVSLSVGTFSDLTDDTWACWRSDSRMWAHTTSNHMPATCPVRSSSADISPMTLMRSFPLPIDLATPILLRCRPGSGNTEN